MALDREKILQSAQKYASKKKYDRAIEEYQKIVQQDPNDARTLLKIGDLQARMEAYAEAIATYDRVGQFYAAQGFALKAIAVYKQIRELIIKYVPHLADRYGHIVPKLAEIYSELGLVSDALAAYDEVATRLQKNGRDRDAIDIFRRMVSLDATNPLPHLRLAEACCRVQSVDEAIDAFWTAAELLIRLSRRDDALKVVERILHFRQDPRYARVAAELYLERAGPQDGLQALSKLQLCFQHDPKDLETLELLARAFTAINQAPKAIEVKKEMARVARDQGKADLFDEIVTFLLRVAPHDEQVQAFARRQHSLMPESSAASASEVSVDDVELIESSVRPEPLGARGRAPMASSPELEVSEVDFDVEPLSRRPVHSAPDVEIEEMDDFDIEEVGRGPFASAPDLVAVDNDLEAVEEIGDADSVDARAHVRKAMVDAESFRGLRLYSKAIETLRIALEIDPRSIDLREKLRDVLNEAGDRDAAIGEMITLAAIHLDAGEQHKAEAELYQVLELEPDHATACEMLEQLGGFANDTAPGYTEGYSSDNYTNPVGARGSVSDSYDAPLPSYDLEEISAEDAMVHDVDAAALDPFEVDDPFESGQTDVPLPSFPLSRDEELAQHLRAERAAYGATADVDPIEPSFPSPEPVPSFDPLGASSTEAVEEALDEADFFASRGLFDDARMILTDQLGRTPHHPLLLERLSEIEQAILKNAKSGTRDRAEFEIEEIGPEDDSVFDIAASLDALDELEEATRSSRPPSSIKAAEEVDVDQVFAKFKEGVRAQVAETDSSTHYDLGVAYKEMGLLSDAVSEFEIAARDPKIECMCCAMIGMICLEQGELDKAADAYVRGLGASQKTIDQEMSLYYDLGIVYEMKGSASEALYYFKKIARRDPGYRDVRERIEALEPARAPESATTARSLEADDEFDAAFDELFESK